MKFLRELIKDLSSDSSYEIKRRYKDIQKKYKTNKLFYSHTDKVTVLKNFNPNLGEEVSYEYFNILMPTYIFLTDGHLILQSQNTAEMFNKSSAEWVKVNPEIAFESKYINSITYSRNHKTQHNQTDVVLFDITVDEVNYLVIFSEGDPIVAAIKTFADFLNISISLLRKNCKNYNKYDEAMKFHRDLVFNSCFMYIDERVEDLNYYYNKVSNSKNK